MGAVWTFFSHLSFLFSFSLSLGETARYRLKYCLKGRLRPKPTNTRADGARVSNSGASTHSANRGCSAVEPWYKEESLLKFVTSLSMSLVGMSNCGKTTYILKLLQQAKGVFTEPPKRVIVCYNIFKVLFRWMAETVPNISFYQGLPDRATIEDWASKTEGHLMLVFDDLYQESIQNKAVCDLTIMLSHHLNISCIMASQYFHVC